jgi:pyrimidine deaminase RibD-like protein
MIGGRDLSESQADHAQWLHRAIELSRQCPASDRSFAVGAIVVDANGNELARGFSLELGDGFHAEEAAILKARRAGLDVRGSTIYSSLEPCSVRLSGKRPCVDHIIEAGILQVVYALAEPPLFVEGKGDQLLRQHGIQVVRLPELAHLVEQVNAHLLATGTRLDRLKNA